MDRKLIICVSFGSSYEETIKKRLNEAKRELKAGSEFDYQVINDNLDDALSTLQQIIDTERNKNVNG